MRHHRRTQHGDRDVKAVAVDARNQSRDHAREFRARHENLGRKAQRDHGNQRQYHGFQITNAHLLQAEHQQRIESRDSHRDQQGNVEEKIEGDGRAQHLRQIARHNRNLAQNPERYVDAARIRFAASLGEIPPGDDPQPGTQRLQKYGHGVRHDQHPQQFVPELGAALEVGRPVARVHVADADEIGGSAKRQHAPPERHVIGRDAVVNVVKRPALR